MNSYGTYIPPQQSRNKSLYYAGGVIVLLVIAAASVAGYQWMTSARSAEDRTNWVDYSSVEGCYRAKFPTAPTEDIETVQTEVGPITMHATQTKAADSSFYIGWWDVPSGSVFMMEQSLRGVIAYFNGSEPEISFARHQGVDAILADADVDGVALREMIFRFGNRVFVVGVLNRVEDWDYFIENFVVNFQTEPNAAPAPANTNSEPGPLQVDGPYSLIDYVGRELRIGVSVSGGVAPYHCEVEDLPDSWELVEDSGAAARGSKTAYVALGVGESPGDKFFKFNVTDAAGGTQQQLVRLKLIALPHDVCELGIAQTEGERGTTSKGGVFKILSGIYFKFTIEPHSGIKDIGHEIRIESTEYEWSSTTLPEGIRVTDTSPIVIEGVSYEPCEIRLNVSVSCQFTGFAEPFERSVEVNIVVQDLTEENWPETPGVFKSELSNLWKNVSASGRVWIEPIHYPYESGSWPMGIEWAWDEDDLPPGMRLSANGQGLSIYGAPTESGEYNVEFTATVRLKGVDKDYSLKFTLKFDVQ